MHVVATFRIVVVVIESPVHVIPSGGTTVKTGPRASFVMIAIMLCLRDTRRERTDRCQQ
jgi:hypothetical protein